VLGLGLNVSTCIEYFSDKSLLSNQSDGLIVRWEILNEVDFSEIIFAVVFYAIIFSQASTAQLEIGWLEKVAASHNGFPIEAKIDTGADNSSVNA
jgi:hypothetical protein